MVEDYEKEIERLDYTFIGFVCILAVVMGLIVIDTIQSAKDNDLIAKEAESLCESKEGISDIGMGYNFCIINNTKYEINGKVTNNEIEYLYFKEVS